MRFLLAFRFADYTFLLVLLSGSEKAGSYARWDRSLYVGGENVDAAFPCHGKDVSSCSSPHPTGREWKRR